MKLTYGKHWQHPSHQFHVDIVVTDTSKFPCSVTLSGVPDVELIGPPNTSDAAYPEPSTGCLNSPLLVHPSGCSPAGARTLH